MSGTGPRRPGPAPAAGERVVYGVRPVEEICRARPRDVAVVYVAEGARSPELARAIAAAKDRAVSVEIRPRAVVAALAGGAGAHQGVVAIVGAFRYATADEILARAEAAAEAALVVVLDGVTDPQNLGAVIRSAEVLGAHGVIVPERGAAPVATGAVKAAAGATERVLVARAAALLETIDRLRARGVRVWGAAAGRGDAASAVDLRPPTAFVLGSESRGLREAVARRCDGLVTIPQRGLVGSLNVSAAGAILLYEAARQRGGRAGPS